MRYDCYFKNPKWASELLKKIGVYASQAGRVRLM